MSVFKACEESKPQQSFDCEDWDDEYNAENALLFGFLLYFYYICSGLVAHIGDISA